ncbi:MAG: hypothetical protein ACLFSM_01645 [Thermoplasmata archaeon]
MGSFSEYRFEINDSKIYLFGIVKGLVSEADRLKDIVKGLEFKVGGLPISKEEKKGLKELIINEDMETDIEPSRPEKAYAKKLSEFGEVSLPPPSYTFFLKYCLENDIETEAIDMDEEHYTMAYCDNVSGFQWIRQSIREKGLFRKDIDANHPVEFAKKWDGFINKLKGFQKLEAYREKTMAKNIYRLSKRGDMVVLIEEERIDGVKKKLKEINRENPKN